MKLKKDGLASVISKLENMADLSKNADEVMNRLVDIGVEEVRKAHKGSMGTDFIVNENGNINIDVYSDAKVFKEVDGNSYSVVAEGENFVFHEFGAGVKKNRPRNWSNDLGIPVPSGISPIGQYGKGQGSQELWAYQKDGSKVITSGYEAVHGFANAINEIVANVDKVMKEVEDE